MDELKKPSIFEANMVYLSLGFALLYIGYIVQSREVYSGLLITEYIIILLPNLLYLKLRGFSLKEVLKLNPINLKQIIYITLIMIFSYPIAVFLNAVVLIIINNFSDILPTAVPIPTNLLEYFLGMFVIALAPGICEEVMFRGTMKSSYDRLGYIKSIIITAVLFGVFHFNIMNLVGPIFLGIILGVLVYKTNSLLASILAHTLNNGIALTIGFIITKYSNQIDEMANNTPIIPEGTQMLITLITLGSLALISLGLVYFLLKNIPSYNKSLDINEYTEITFKEEKFKSLKYVPLLIVFVTFIVLNIQMLF